MRRVYKYPIEIESVQTITVNKGAKFIHGGLDPNGVPCIWFEVDTDQPTQRCNIFIYGTGHNLCVDGLSHMFSFVKGSFVWHLYW